MNTGQPEGQPAEDTEARAEEAARGEEAGEG